MVQVTQIRFWTDHDRWTCKQEKNAWIPIFSDWIQASFICGNKSDMNQIRAFACAM